MNPNDERDGRELREPADLSALQDSGDAMETLLARLERVDPPPDFVARVMARARQTEAARWPRWQRLLFGAGYLAALFVLAVLAFLTGAELEHAGLRDLLSLALHDWSVVTHAPDVYLRALRDAIPWAHVLLILGDAILLGVATRFVLKVAAPAAEQGASVAA